MFSRLFIILLAFTFLSACSDDDLSPLGETPGTTDNGPGDPDLQDPPGDQTEDPRPVLAESIIIEASKSYNPSNWNDAEILFEDTVYARLPEYADVLQGQSGNHWISVYLGHVSGKQWTCIYKGLGSRSKTTNCQNNGSRYEFSYCAESIDYAAEGCGSNPFRDTCKQSIALNHGMRLPINDIQVSVNNGDRCDTTVIELEITDLEYKNP